MLAVTAATTEAMAVVAAADEAVLAVPVPAGTAVAPAAQQPPRVCGHPRRLRTRPRRGERVRPTAAPPPAGPPFPSHRRATPHALPTLNPALPAR